MDFDRHTDLCFQIGFVVRIDFVGYHIDFGCRTDFGYDIGFDFESDFGFDFDYFVGTGFGIDFDLDSNICPDL
ncbi:hypothetical protein UACE39S_02339 [Ureibacillus acetophenoni]